MFNNTLFPSSPPFLVPLSVLLQFQLQQGNWLSDTNAFFCICSVDKLISFLLKNRSCLFEEYERDKKFWELQGLFMNWVSHKMGLSLLYFFKKQFNFRFYLLLPFISEAKGHSVNDGKWQETQAQLMERIPSGSGAKNSGDLTHAPKLPDRAS